ncbi:hypothetical protein F6W69_09145 [Microbacterium oxydans]|nr:hypothetical protein F6W69_09145 [Microbacterium oxydans]
MTGRACAVRGRKHIVHVSGRCGWRTSRNSTEPPTGVEGSVPDDAISSDDHAGGCVGSVGGVVGEAGGAAGGAVGGAGGAGGVDGAAGGADGAAGGADGAAGGVAGGTGAPVAGAAGGA